MQGYFKQTGWQSILLYKLTKLNETSMVGAKLHLIILAS